MKITLFKTASVVMVVFVAAYALSTKVSAQEVSADANVSVTVSPSLSPVKTPPVKPTLKAQIEKNQNERNTMLKERQMIKTDLHAEVKEIRTDAKDMRMEMRADMKSENGSSTNMFKRGAEVRKDIAKKMEAKVFEARKTALIKELSLSITNITEISTRIETRITKSEAEGHSMTDARALLVTANEKLTKAKADVAAFQTLAATQTTTNANASTSAEIDLTKPRALGDTAIKSVKDARDAFQKVVTSIAKTLGVKAEMRMNASTSSQTSGTVTN